MPKVSKYLQKCVLPVTYESIPREKVWSRVVVVPVRNEDELLQSFIERTDGISPDNTLVILVLNDVQPRDPPQLWLEGKEINRTCRWTRLKHSDWLILDYASENEVFGEKDGVGRARKIGADIAAHLWESGNISDPWIRNTDVDARLPSDYFSDLGEEQGCVVYDFRHMSDHANPIRARAIHVYDAWLRFYAAGLQSVGSPYGFVAIGSCLAVHAKTYIAARGFPQRLAGEDFHFLRKATKIAGWRSKNGQPIELVDRVSLRVPFGTGPSIEAMEVGSNPENERRFYDPRCFVRLREILESFKTGDPRTIVSALATTQVYDTQQLIAWERDFMRIRSQTRTPQTFEKAAHQHFDALRSLQFIRRCSQIHYPLLGFADLARLGESFPKIVGPTYR